MAQGLRCIFFFFAVYFSLPEDKRGSTLLPILVSLAPFHGPAGKSGAGAFSFLVGASVAARSAGLPAPGGTGEAARRPQQALPSPPRGAAPPAVRPEQERLGSEPAGRLLLLVRDTVTVLIPCPLASQGRCPPPGASRGKGGRPPFPFPRPLSPRSGKERPAVPTRSRGLPARVDTAPSSPPPPLPGARLRVCRPARSPRALALARTRCPAPARAQ